MEHTEVSLKLSYKLRNMLVSFSTTIYEELENLRKFRQGIPKETKFCFLIYVCIFKGEVHLAE